MRKMRNCAQLIFVARKMREFAPTRKPVALETLVLSQVQNTTSKPETDSRSAVLQSEPLLLPNIQPKPLPSVNPPPVPLILHHGIKPYPRNPAPTPKTGVSIEDFRRVVFRVFFNYWTRGSRILRTSCSKILSTLNLSTEPATSTELILHHFYIII